uniref:Uncharacterized protein n=1 Tax=Rhizophora mucronata TaxID=61149 RepID=A0A2P2N472_RHIMU
MKHYFLENKDKLCIFDPF